MDDDELGQAVFGVIVAHARAQRLAGPVTWTAIPEHRRELYRRIGRSLFQLGADFERSRLTSGLVVDAGGVMHDPAETRGDPQHEDFGLWARRCPC